MGTGPSKAAAEALVLDSEGPWSRIKQELKASDLTFNIGVYSYNEEFSVSINPHRFDKTTATPAVRAIVADLQADKYVSTLEAHARAAFVDMTRWCTDHVTFPAGRQPVRKIATLPNFFTTPPHRDMIACLGVTFFLSEKAMEWFTKTKEKRLLYFFMTSLAARVGHQLRAQFDLSFVVQKRQSGPVETNWCRQQRVDAAARGTPIESMMALDDFRKASRAAPNAALYAQFSTHPFSRIAFSGTLPKDTPFVGCQLCFCHLAMVRAVSKAGCTVGQ